jgi:hypothetical protein
MKKWIIVAMLLCACSDPSSSSVKEDSESTDTETEQGTDSDTMESTDSETEQDLIEVDYTIYNNRSIDSFKNKINYILKLI